MCDKHKMNLNDILKELDHPVEDPNVGELTTKVQFKKTKTKKQQDDAEYRATAPSSSQIMKPMMKSKRIANKNKKVPDQHQQQEEESKF